TIACSVHEKRTRASPALIVSVRPSDAGRISTSTSTAAPTDVQAQRYAPARLPYIASGTVAPGLSLRQACRLIDISATQIHVPTTTRTKPAQAQRRPIRGRLSASSLIA